MLSEKQTLIANAELDIRAFEISSYQPSKNKAYYPQSYNWQEKSTLHSIKRGLHKTDKGAMLFSDNKLDSYVCVDLKVGGDDKLLASR